MAKLDLNPNNWDRKLTRSKGKPVLIGNNTTAEWFTPDTTDVGDGSHAQAYARYLVRLHARYLVRLHGYAIVVTNGHGDALMFTLAGWPPVTTRERVNQFLPPGLGVVQRNHVQFYGTLDDGGHWTEINCDDWYYAESYMPVCLSLLP